MTQNIYFSAGEVIFRQGYPGDDAYIVISGQVEIYKETPEGAVEEVVAILGEREMFGELAILDDAPRSASARAKTDVVLQIMPI
jgi:CRP-like cAMP-binding protein